MPLPEIRVFVAHAKGIPDDQLINIREALRDTLKKKNPAYTFNVVNGKDDYEQRAANGKLSWNFWTKSVADFRDASTRDPRFHLIIVPAESMDIALGYVGVGKATAMIVKLCHETGKQISAFDFDNNQGYAIVGASTRDEKDYVSGWTLRIGDKL